MPKLLNFYSRILSHWNKAVNEIISFLVSVGSVYILAGVMIGTTVANKG